MDLIDHDNTKNVDFNKFCLINTDKSKNIFKQIEDQEKIKLKNKDKK